MKIIGRGWYTGTRNYDTGSGFAIAIKKEDRDRFFKKAWKSVVLRFEGFNEEVEVNIDKFSFWNKCPELYKKEIGIWFKENNVIKWPKRKPPRVELEQIKENFFNVKLLI
ncbi:hypothetical protein ES703_74835 [subsurface metagenome]